LRQFPNKLNDIIAQSGLRLNTISKASGISHTYLSKLTQGNVNRPGKDKIASILLALNYTIGAINRVLAVYDYRRLSTPDIPEILKNNLNRKIEGGFQASYDRIYFDMLLTTMEGLGGKKILVKDTPSAVFKPDALYLQDEYPYSFEKNDEDETFRQALTSALLKQRKDIFLRNCDKGYPFHTYICKRCLQDYLEKHLASPAPSGATGQSDRVVEFFANMIHAVQLHPEQHRTLIVERCTFYHFVVQPAGGKHPRVLFLGRKPHHYNNVYEQQNLEGFTSDSPSTIALFMQEAELCRKAVDRNVARDYPKHLIAYIKGLFRQAGQAKALEKALKAIDKHGAMAFY
jgi:transcriptional regulator with XRE-family HTH domain